MKLEWEVSLLGSLSSSSSSSSKLYLSVNRSSILHTNW